VWISKGDKYPFTSPETWRTRSWLLVHKVGRQLGSATEHDRRVAMLLLRSPSRLAGNHTSLRGHLEEIAYGSQGHSADATSREDLGANDRHDLDNG